MKEDSRNPTWQPRSAERMPDAIWNATLCRVRGEFDEMPGMRVTPEEARALLDLPDSAARWVLTRLAAEGFLARTSQGEYIRRTGGR